MSSPSRFAHPGTFRATPFLICVAELVSLAGCNNTCFVGVINPPNNSLTVSTGNPPPVCSLARPMAAVKAVAHLARTCTDCSNSRHVTRVHLLLSGMELHPGAVAEDNSPEWQELAPDWARQPKEVDLRGDPTSSDLSPPLNVTGQIAAGSYYQLRLRLAQSSSQHAEQLHGESHCSSVEESCIVTTDGSVHPLQTPDGQPYLRVEAMSPIDLRTDQPNRLRIELRLEWVLQIPSNGVLGVTPLLRGRVIIDPSAASDSF
jgi:hypothetical protein